MNNRNNSQNLTIAHLYPQEMNIYGDMGNVVCLQRRCEWRGIKTNIINVNLGELTYDLEADIYFMGGGQDNDMYQVFQDILTYKKSVLTKEVASKKVFLLVCGALQLFGEYFLDASGRTITGLGILPITTKAPSDIRADRCLGNLVSIIDPVTLAEINSLYSGSAKETLVGFENHSGQTYSTKELTAIAEVVVGKGINSTQKQEGLRLNNIFATYSHGSFLPKNPHMADFLLTTALRNKYGPEYILQPLDDTIEWLAHDNAVARARKLMH